MLKTYSQGPENNDVKYLCFNWFRGWDRKAWKLIVMRLTKAENKVARVYQSSCEKAFFINSPSHIAIPQAQIERSERARERLREGEGEQDSIKKGRVLFQCFTHCWMIKVENAVLIPRIISHLLSTSSLWRIMLQDREGENRGEEENRGRQRRCWRKSKKKKKKSNSNTTVYLTPVSFLTQWCTLP